MKHLNEDDLILLYYGELTDHGDSVAHLDACEQCRSEYDRLKATLAALDSAGVPDWTVSQADGMWQRLRPRLMTAPQVIRVGPSQGRRWAIAAAMAACLMAAFMLGRYWPRPDLETASAPAGNVRERILLVAVGDHLERSQVMLVDLVNSQGNGTIDMTADQARAQDLISGNRLYRHTAEREGDLAVADVLDQLERILVEIANGPSQLTARQFEQLRKTIESQGIILKVRLVGARARQFEHAPGRKSVEPTI